MGKVELASVIVGPILAAFSVVAQALPEVPSLLPSLSSAGAIGVLAYLVIALTKCNREEREKLALERQELSKERITLMTSYNASIDKLVTEIMHMAQCKRECDGKQG